MSAPKGKARANLIKVRDHIASLPPGRFNMRYLFKDRRGERWSDEAPHAQLVHPCGTAACIAGWTLALFAPNKRGGDADDAQTLLGLDEYQADELFLPQGYRNSRRYTQARAVRTLDHLIATGEVDWDAKPAEGAK